MSRELGIKKISTLLLIFITISLLSVESLPTANGALTPLTPTIEATPKRVSIDENITLTVEITVNEPCNVSASRPVISGAGDASLKFENASIILNPGDTGKLEWIYGATQTGAVTFATTVAVKKLSDDSVVLTQPVNSQEIGISKLSEMFLAGLIILALYVLITSKFDWSKPKESVFMLFGGWLGIIYIVAFTVIGYLFATVTFTIINPEISITILGLILVLFGIGCCFVHETFRNISQKLTSPSSKLNKRIQNAMLTELAGLSIVVFGLSGFFIAWQVWSGLILLLMVGVIAMGKEFIEMKLQ